MKIETITNPNILENLPRPPAHIWYQPEVGNYLIQNHTCESKWSEKNLDPRTKAHELEPLRETKIVFAICLLASY